MFSAEIDNNGTFRDGYLNPRVERSRGVIDEPSIINATAVYHASFGEGHAWGKPQYVERSVIGGWQLSGIYTYNSGIPLTESLYRVALCRAAEPACLTRTQPSAVRYASMAVATYDCENLINYLLLPRPYQRD